MGRRALALIALAACGSSPPPVTTVTAPASDAAMPDEGGRVPDGLASGRHFRVALDPLPACSHGTPCEVRVIIDAHEGFKVNAEYPTKFVASATPGITVDGTGTFEALEPYQGAVTIRFTAAKAGAAQLSGALKFSVCTDDVCEIEAPVIKFDVPVT